MKRRHYFHFFLGGIAASAALLAACSGSNGQVTGRSDYYTRGIGQYPGSPQEDFSTELVKDNTYRTHQSDVACGLSVVCLRL